MFHLYPHWFHTVFIVYVYDNIGRGVETEKFANDLIFELFLLNKTLYIRLFLTICHPPTCFVKDPTFTFSCQYLLHFLSWILKIASKRYIPQWRHHTQTPLPHCHFFVIDHRSLPPPQVMTSYVNATKGDGDSRKVSFSSHETQQYAPSPLSPIY